MSANDLAIYNIETREGYSDMVSKVQAMYTVVPIGAGSDDDIVKKDAKLEKHDIPLVPLHPLWI